MGFEVAVHAQRGGMGRHLPQQSLFHEQPQIVVDRGERNRGYAPFDDRVDLFGRVVSGSSHDGFKYDLPLVRGSHAMLPGKLSKLLMTQMHDAWMRIIIKQFSLFSN